MTCLVVRHRLARFRWAHPLHLSRARPRDAHPSSLIEKHYVLLPTCCADSCRIIPICYPKPNDERCLEMRGYGVLAYVPDHVLVVTYPMKLLRLDGRTVNNSKSAHWSHSRRLFGARALVLGQCT
jgi:hypothetical protein